MLSDWLDLSFEGKTPRSRTGGLANGRYRLLGSGMLELVPNTPQPEAYSCVISAGIHGNETAPIELVGELLAALETGQVRLGAPLLILLGNLPAIAAGQRFINTNLNRLFRRDLEESGPEPDRARELMATVDAFYARHQDHPPLHYDMHTAIRDSRYPRFAVEPYGEGPPTEENQWHWLAGAGLQAVLHQHCHSWTFSHYSRHYHGAQAFTLELGKVAEFGHNDLTALRPMSELLKALAEGVLPASAPPSRMAFFQVERELMRESEDFSLCFAEDTPNFTEFAPGRCLARDATAGECRVGNTPLAVVFPNAEVEIGARAALLVAATPPPRT